jgi:dsDNA-specific endonuclease/ATPase MutS2
MSARFAPGDAVQTPFGKGVVHDVRNNGQLLVLIQQRTLVVDPQAATALTARPGLAVPFSGAAGGVSPHREAPKEVDLHGLRVDEALARIDGALDAALRAGHAELRFIHGRSGGRLRGALHERLRAISAVRGLRLDPHNPGVTIVSL